MVTRLVFESGSNYSTLNNFDCLDISKFQIVNNPEVHIVGNKIVMNFDYLVIITRGELFKMLMDLSLGHMIIGYPITPKPIQIMNLTDIGVNCPKTYSLFHSTSSGGNVNKLFSMVQRDSFKDNNYTDNFVFKPNFGSRSLFQFILNINDLTRLSSQYIKEIIKNPKSVRLEHFDNPHENNNLISDSIKCDSPTLNCDSPIDAKPVEQEFDYLKLANTISIDCPQTYHLSKVVDDCSVDFQISSDDGDFRREYRVVQFYDGSMSVVRRFRKETTHTFIENSEHDKFDFDDLELYQSEIFSKIKGFLKWRGIPFLSLDVYIIPKPHQCRNEDDKFVNDIGVFEMQMELGLSRHKTTGSFAVNLNNSMELLCEDRSIKVNLERTINIPDKGGIL